MTCAERVVVVTSAALGMGRVIAQRFVQQGARVALCDQNVTGLAETVASIQRQGEKG
ncbi:MAG: SDR family NAD(P)-dependent oxidoreductase [Candidatus Tectomicrobia bacterium]